MHSQQHGQGHGSSSGSGGGGFMAKAQKMAADPKTQKKLEQLATSALKKKMMGGKSHGHGSGY
jgi:hypothetical protein